MIYDPYPQMFLFMKKKNLLHFFMDGLKLSQGQNENHFLEGVFVRFTIKFAEIVGTHFLSTSEGRTIQIPRSDPKKGVSVLIQLKCYFLRQMKVSGYTTLVSDTKISKLILCFSILLLQISCRVQKNLARLRGGNILSSCINAQLIELSQENLRMTSCYSVYSI